MGAEKWRNIEHLLGTEEKSFTLLTLYDLLCIFLGFIISTPFLKQFEIGQIAIHFNTALTITLFLFEKWDSVLELKRKAPFLVDNSYFAIFEFVQSVHQ